MTSTQQPYADLVKAAIDEARDELVAVSKDIHAHPELNYQETYSSAALATALERHGFSVERGVGGVETAFRAEAQGNRRRRPHSGLPSRVRRPPRHRPRLRTQPHRHLQPGRHAGCRQRPTRPARQASSS